MHGITVDHKAIAAGMLELVEHMDESYANAIRFGMTPAPLMQPLERMLGEKFDELALAQVKMTKAEYDQCESWVREAVQIDRAKRAQFVRETTNKVHCELLRLGGCLV